MKLMKWNQFKKAMNCYGAKPICNHKLTYAPERKSIRLNHEMAVMSFYSKEKDITYLWVKDGGILGFVFGLSDDTEGVCCRLNGKVTVDDVVNSNKYNDLFTFLFWQYEIDRCTGYEDRERLRKENIIYFPVKGMEVKHA